MLLADYKTRWEGLPDLLMYASVIDEGVMLLQDGALMATWQYRGPDLASATHEEIEHKCSPQQDLAAGNELDAPRRCGPLAFATLSGKLVP